MSDKQNLEKRKNQYDSPNYKNCGRKPNQKLKSFIIFIFLWKYSDENHPLPVSTLQRMMENFDIIPERRSIYRDIREINEILLILEHDTDIYSIKEMFEDDFDDELPIVYDAHKKGYYFRHRPFDLNDMQIIAQSLCSAKFITKEHSERLIKLICEFVSECQGEQIQETAYLFDNEKTNHAATIYNIVTINDAMSFDLNGASHTAEKISFDYLEYAIDETTHRPVFVKTKNKIVSPYHLLTKDGDIFLLAYDEFSDEVKTYTIGRMSKVSLTGEKRAGQHRIHEINIQNFYRNGFSSFVINPQRITLQFKNRHLETVAEYFDKETSIYSKIDDDHFSVIADVEISALTFNWLLGFGTEAKITKPISAVEAFQKYISKISDSYNEKQ